MRAGACELCCRAGVTGAGIGQAGVLVPVARAATAVIQANAVMMLARWKSPAWLAGLGAWLKPAPARAGFAPRRGRRGGGAERPPWVACPVESPGSGQARPPGGRGRPGARRCRAWSLMRSAQGERPVSRAGSRQLGRRGNMAEPSRPGPAAPVRAGASRVPMMASRVRDRPAAPAAQSVPAALKFAAWTQP